MTHMFEPIVIAPGQVANVSRRVLLKGIVGSGALVLGTSLLPRPAMADWATGAGAMPGAAAGWCRAPAHLTRRCPSAARGG